MKRKPAEPEKRGPGQPRKIPADARRRNWYATDAEYAQLQREAKKAGTSAAELVRRRALNLE